jgi:glucose-6-phosphate isomerase
MAKKNQATAKRSSARAWKEVAAHYKTVSKVHLRQLFADDPKRGERLAIEAVGLYLDYSKNRVTDETVKLLLPACGLISMRCSAATK